MKALLSLRLYTLLYIILSFLPLRASDSVEVSLLTCSPGTEVYELYGHTALRYHDLRTGADVVFNYGVFDFKAPNFVWRFVRGETDYMVIWLPFEVFCKSYRERGSSVTAQVLNLTPEEKERLGRSLFENCLPQNRVYRYNFLTNNCTTKVRDQLEQALNGELMYPTYPPIRTYRQILHEATRQHPWAELGNDFCLGEDVDTLLWIRAMTFSPLYMQDFAEQMEIYDGKGNFRPFVLRTETVVPLGVQQDAPSTAWPPMAVFVMAALLLIGITVNEAPSGRSILWQIDAVLLTLQGLAGCVLCFLFFFSEHPGVSSNWLIIIFNPLPLFAIRPLYRSLHGGRQSIYPLGSFVILTFFITSLNGIPQDIPAIIVPLVLVLLARSAQYLYYYKKHPAQ